MTRQRSPLTSPCGGEVDARSAAGKEYSERAIRCSAGALSLPAIRFSESPITNPQSRSQTGFTLIEVLIALAVVALALLALARAASVQVQTFDALRERTLAGWVAENVLADTRVMAPPPGAGRSDGRVTLAGRDWRWRRDIQPTPDSDILRIDVQVFLGASTAPSATLSGFRGEGEQ